MIGKIPAFKDWDDYNKKDLESIIDTTIILSVLKTEGVNLNDTVMSKMNSNISFIEKATEMPREEVRRLYEGT